MTPVERESDDSGPAIKKLPIAGAVAALCGLADAGYLTVHHYTNVPVPCSLVAGCETVLTSQYAELAGIPIAVFGAVAYFAAFSLAVLAAFGNRIAWLLFGIQAALMSAVTLWLIYLQAFVIGAFCQFCLISAFTTLSMFVIFIVSRMRIVRMPAV